MDVFYLPATEQYARELHVFRRHGWEVWFGHDLVVRKVRLYGRYTQSGLSWYENVPPEALADPTLMRAFNARQWDWLRNSFGEYMS